MKTNLLTRLIVLLITLSGLFNIRCSDRNELKVIGKNFSEEVEGLQNLVFTFNRDVWPEHLLDQWDSTGFILFEPAIPGKFRWTAANELVFSPSSGMKAATDYTARLSDDLLKHSERSAKLKVNRDRIAFHTPFLALTAIRSWWVISEESGRPESRVRLDFNYPIDISGIRERLQVREGKTSVLAYRLLPSQSQGAVTLALTNEGAGGGERDLEVVLEKGIKIEGENYTSGKTVSRTFRLPSSARLGVADVASGFENNKGYMIVYTSQDVVPEQLSGGISLQPEIPFVAEPVDGGFAVKADFLESETYVLKLRKTLKGVLGHTLEEEESRDFFFGKMPESIRFVNRKAQYLSPKGNRNIGVSITNVPSVQVRISKIYDNNLLFYLHNGRYENYSELGGVWQRDGTHSFSEDYGGQYSDVLVDKKVSTADIPEIGGVKALNLAIPEVHGKARKGVYLVSVSSSDAMYLSDRKLVSVSDIGLIVKQGKDEVWVFANSIHDTSPLKNVEISLVSTNNQEMYRIMTDGEGVAHLAGLSEKAPGFRLAMVTASLGDDFNYLAMEDAAVETSRFEVGGARSGTTGIQAFIYGERDVYRPGETLQFVSVLRTEDWKTLAGFPVKMRLVTPNGQVYGSWLKETDRQGATDLSVKVEEASLTGPYTLELYNANEVLLASSSVNVEEFVPDRIKVDLSGGKMRYETGEQVRLQATATNLFGPPASGRAFEMESQLKRKPFRAKDFPEYVFEIPAEVSFERIKKQGVTDQEGKAAGEFSLAASYRDIGMLDGKIFVTVFDENGRAVNRIHSFEVATQPVFFGVRLPDRYVGVNAPVEAEILSVDPSGKIKTGQNAGVEVIRVTYQTVIEKKGGRMQYTSKRKDETVYSNTLKLVNGRGSFRYTPAVSGEYEIRVRRPGSDRFTTLTYYAYGYGATQYSSFEVSNEGRVLIETDKSQYRPGEKAKVLFKAPFDGKLIVTVEQGEVMRHEVITTKNKAAEITLPVQKSYLPNVYITATLMRPMRDETIPLTVAHGFEAMTVVSDDRVLDVQITAPMMARSKTRQKIKIKTQPNTRLSVAVVDEGILQIRNFATPDIYGHFYQKRALEVRAADLYAWLFPELDLGKRSSSGGDGFGLERRINPLGNGNRQLVRFWSGLLETDKRGEAEYEIEVPQFSGALRVMAVAFKDQAFGSSSQQIKVSDPVVMSAGVPRFLSPGDEVLLPVTITNTEKRATTGEVSVAVKDGLEISGAASQRINLPQGEEERFFVKLKAGKQLGKGKVTIETKAFGERFTQEYELVIRPSSPLLKVANSGTINGGSSKVLKLNEGFMPGTSAVQLVLSRSPLVAGGGKALSTLLGYPHGCLEQSVSKAFPQIYFGELVRSMDSGISFVNRGASDLNPAFNVQQTIRKAESQQLFNGGFAMWPGNVRDDWWVSAYTLQFLDEARRAGFDVNPSVLRSAVKYLTNRSQRRQTETIARKNEDGSKGAEEMAPIEAIYSLYVLAATGNPDRPMMNYYKQHEKLLTNEMRYLLAGAYHYIGDPGSYKTLLPDRYEADGRLQGQPYTSRLSGLGIVLNMLIDADPQNLQIPVLARQLSAAIASGSTLNTQEAVFSVLALGKIARQTSSSSVTADVLADGNPIGRFDGSKELTITDERLLSGQVEIKTQGAGSLYWFSETSGFDAGGIYTEEEEGLRVRRYYLDRNGKLVTNFSQNDLVVVKITLSSTNRLTIPNVVITDLLPAGFEVENPRLTGSREMSWIKKVSNPEYFDIRDDRIHYFVTATPAEKTFYYQVRVTSPGSFNVGPVAADAMYQTHLKSYSGGRKIEVK